MTVAVAVAGNSYRMLKEKNMDSYSDKHEDGTKRKGNKNIGGDNSFCKKDISSTDAERNLSNISYSLEKTTSASFMNEGKLPPTKRSHDGVFSTIDSSSASSIDRPSKKNRIDDSISQHQGLIDKDEQLDLLNRSVPAQVQLELIQHQIEKLKSQEIQGKQQKMYNSLLSTQQQLLENESALLELGAKAKLEVSSVLPSSLTSPNNKLNDNSTQGPYRRLSMLAAASLLDTATPKSSGSNTSLDVSPMKQDLDLRLEGVKQSTHLLDGVENLRRQARRRSLDSTDGLDEYIGRMSRRNSLLSTTGPNDVGGDIDSAIVSRRLSLIAAQAASLESRRVSRRASLIAAAEIFESMNNEAATRKRSSVLNGFDKRMSFDRRNSLLAVSNLLRNIETGNGTRRTSAAFRRGSDASLGSVFNEPDTASLMPSRRGSLDSLATNINLNRFENEKGTKTLLDTNVDGKDTLGSLLGKDDSNKIPEGIDVESFKSLYLCMEKSKASQTAIHDWDRKMGLRRSHSQTMRNSSRSRKKLITVMTLEKKS